MVAVIGELVEFVAVNDEMSPVPLEASPILVLVFVQVKVPPVGLLAKLVAETVPLSQTEIFEGTDTVEIGITVIV